MSGRLRARRRATPCLVEVPTAHFADARMGPIHRRFFSTLLSAMAARQLRPQLIEVPHGADEAQRTPLPGAVHFAYHCFGPARPGLRRVKCSSVAGHYDVDSMGFSGWSSLALEAERHRPLWQALDLDEARASVSALHEDLRARNASKFTQAETPFEVDEPFVFLPLQTTNDRVVELFRLPFLDALDAAIAAARPGRRLVIKRHPLCRSRRVAVRLRGLRRHPHVTVTDASIHAIMPRAALVLVGNSGVGFEALLAGRPVATFAQAEYQAVTRQLHGAADIRAVFEDEIRHDPDEAVRFVHYKMTRAAVGVDDGAALGRLLDEALDEAWAARAAAGSASASRIMPEGVPAFRATLVQAARAGRGGAPG
ncbi:MAG: hypothetical protein MUF65_07065 [Rubritepida sp.]|nr:hypothetical protein [Rubritepida sp.]